nr:PREDICTED: uncharacterized protein LOC104244945 isoform X2 [Nicotiana sylvestris]
MDGGRRLSYGLSSTGAGDLSQTLHPSPLRRPLCAMLSRIRDAYIQKTDETMVADGPISPSTIPTSTTHNHATAHPAIKRQRDEDYPNSVSGRDGMRLRPVCVCLTTCCFKWFKNSIHVSWLSLAQMAKASGNISPLASTTTAINNLISYFP